MPRQGRCMTCAPLLRPSFRPSRPSDARSGASRRGAVRISASSPGSSSRARCSSHPGTARGASCSGHAAQRTRRSHSARERRRPCVGTATWSTCPSRTHSTPWNRARSSSGHDGHAYKAHRHRSRSPRSSRRPPALHWVVVCRQGRARKGPESSSSSLRFFFVFYIPFTSRTRPTERGTEQQKKTVMPSDHQKTVIPFGGLTA